MASKIKVDQIQTGDGTGTIALQNQLSGMTTASLPALGSAQMPTGSVLQVQQGISTINIASTTADTWIDAVTVNITPSSTSSKIYVSFNINAMIISDNQRGGVRMARNSTGIGVATNVQSRIAASATFAGTSDGTLRSKNMSNSVLDSPSTTSQITYRLQYHCENTTEVKINHDDADGNADSYYRSASTITVMEIAG
tara:strand:- start:163 stop:753 length:591 start_codon:yes stop_codon:yes gene_type:complete